MHKRLSVVVIGMIALFLAACGNTGGNEPSDEIPEELVVNLEVQETADVNEAVPFKATVTQGDEKIKDADEVEFEVWKEDKKEDSEMIEAENNKDGTYEAKKSFEHDGEYIVQVHVTARGLHTMPKKSVTVGEGKQEEHDDHEGHEGDEHGDHAHSEGFSMHVMKPDSITAGKEATFTVHLENKEKPLEKAQVRYEIWNDDISDKHEWVDAKEVKPGEYTGTHSFENTGVYKIQVHVENDEGLHEHEEHEVGVK